MKPTYKTSFGAVFIGFLLCLNAFADLTNGLILHYTFDKDDGNIVVDDSGNGRTAVVNGAIWVANGAQGGAYRFGNSSQSITATDAGLPSGDTARTMALWIKLDAVIPDVATWLLTYGTYSQNQACGTGMDWRVGRDHFFFSPYGAVKLSEQKMTKSRTWYHLAYTYGGNGAHHLYVNGVLSDGENELWGSINTVLSGMLIMGGHSDSAGPNGGYLDDVRIYNRELAAEEIQQLAGPNPAALTQGYHVFDVKIDARLLGRQGEKSVIDTENIQGLLVYNGNTAEAEFFDIARNEIIVLDADFTYDPSTNNSVPKKGITAQGVACAHIHIDGFLDAVTLGYFQLKRTVKGKLMTISLAGAGADVENDAYGAVLLRYNQTISNAMNLAEDAEEAFRAILLKRTGIDILGDK